MSLLDIYKAKQMGLISSESLFASSLGKKFGTAYEKIIESVPYLKRTTANGANVSPKSSDTLVGGSIVWNQYAKEFNSTNWSAESKATASFLDGVATFTSTATSYGIKTTLGKINKSHKYYLSIYAKAESACSIGIILGNTGGTTGSFNIGTERKQYGKIIALGSSVSGAMAYICANSSAVNKQVEVDNALIIDLTQLFGSTIADYIYELEQGTAGAGAAWFRSLGFDADYYAYTTGELKHVGSVSAHVMRDADDIIIGNYALDDTVTLRGKPKISNGSLYYDGDTYESDGTVTRKYGVRAYQSGDESLADAITDGTNTVYKLTTPTTETAEPYTNPQRCEKGGTEEYVSTNIVPVGHNTEYKVAVQ